MKPALVLLTATLVLATFNVVRATIVTVNIAGRVNLSEIHEFAQDDTASGSFTYDTAAEGEFWSNESWGITTTTYRGVAASFRNATGTVGVETNQATITITRVSPDSWLYTPGNELRLHFPAGDLPNAPTGTYASFIGFFSFNDSTGSALADGILPPTLDLDQYQSARFLFAWNRKPGDEAPLEYSGRFLTTADPGPPTLSIRPATEPHLIELQFLARPGFFYQVEFSDDIRDWIPFGDPILGDGRQVSRPMSTLESPTRLYRIRASAGEVP